MGSNILNDSMNTSGTSIEATFDPVVKVHVWEIAAFFEEKHSSICAKNSQPSKNTETVQRTVGKENETQNNAEVSMDFLPLLSSSVVMPESENQSFRSPKRSVRELIKVIENKFHGPAWMNYSKDLRKCSDSLPKTVTPKKAEESNKLKLTEPKENAAVKRKIGEMELTEQETTDYEYALSREEHTSKKLKVEKDSGLEDAFASGSSKDESSPRTETPHWAHGPLGFEAEDPNKLKLVELKGNASIKHKLQEAEQTENIDKNCEQEITEYEYTPSKKEHPSIKSKTEEDYSPENVSASDSSKIEDSPTKEIPDLPIGPLGLQVEEPNELKLGEPEENMATEQKLQQTEQTENIANLEQEMTEYEFSLSRKEYPSIKSKTEEDYSPEDAFASDSSEVENNPRKEIPDLPIGPLGLQVEEPNELKLGEPEENMATELKLQQTEQTENIANLEQEMMEYEGALPREEHLSKKSKTEEDYSLKDVSASGSSKVEDSPRKEIPDLPIGPLGIQAKEPNELKLGEPDRNTASKQKLQETGEAENVPPKKSKTEEDYSLEDVSASDSGEVKSSPRKEIPRQALTSDQDSHIMY